MINSNTLQGAWLNRTVDLSSYAGKTLNSLWIDTDAATPVGSVWDNFFSDIAFVNTDGTVTPLFARDASVPLTYHFGGSIGSPSGVVETSNPAGDSQLPNTTTTYYHEDQIGSARILTSAGGWPIWSDTLYPFGQELSAVSATNHYKFTGKERDAESGNDYFGASGSLLGTVRSGFRYLS